jgi:serine/threonine-protein kinase
MRPARPIATLLVLATVLSSPGVSAQSEADRATAQALFEAGRTLMDAGNFEEACPKLAESHRLEPAVGTQLNLADCYERTGRLASAWTHYQQVAAAAAKGNQPDRARYANERGEALVARLCKVKIDVQAPSPDQKVTRDGALVPAAAWGTPVAVDPGNHEIVATAPGKKEWRETVVASTPGAVVDVIVPRLEDAPVVAPPVAPSPKPAPDKPKPDEPPGDGSAQRIAGIVVGAVGVVAVGVAIPFFPMAVSKDEEAKSRCNPEGTICDAEGTTLRAEAINLQTAGIVLAVAGAVTAVTGLVVFLTAPSGDDAAAPPAASLSVTPLVAPGAALLEARLRL